MISRGPEAISPTAHYTGYVWARNGLAPRALATATGKTFYCALEPAMATNRVLGLPTFEGLLIARHRILDDLLASAIDSGEIGQVIEIAAGLSGRGWRFTRRFGEALTYVDADLPAMAARKRNLLERTGEKPAGLLVAELDALRDEGPHSLHELAGTLDPDVGTAIITEGLLSYFPLDAVTGMWQRFAKALSTFPHGRYLSDLHLRPAEGSAAHRLGSGLLSVVVRGRLHFPFAERDEAVGALLETGFTRAGVRPATSFGTDSSSDASTRIVHIIEASAR